MRKIRKCMAVSLAVLMAASSLQFGSVTSYAVDEPVLSESVSEITEELTNDEAYPTEESSENASNEISEDITKDTSAEVDEGIIADESGEPSEEATTASPEGAIEEVIENEVTAENSEEPVPEIVEDPEALVGEIIDGELDYGVKYTVTPLSGGLTKVVVDATDSSVDTLERGFFRSKTEKDPKDSSQYYQYFDPTIVSEIELKGIKTLGEQALAAEDNGGTKYGFTSLSKLTLPNTLETMDTCAISGDNKLKKVTLPSSVRTLKNGIFFGCPELEEVVLNDGLETVGSDIFYGCNKITSVIIPDSVTTTGTIEAGEDDDTSAVTTISVPISAEITGGGNSFPVSLKKLILTKGSGEYNEKFKLPTTGESGRAFEVVFGEGITYVPESFFQDFDCITKVTFPGTLTSVGDYAFDLIDNLAALEFKEGTGERVITLGTGCFSGLEKLTTLDFPKDVKEVAVDTQPFYCSGLKDVYFRHPQFTLYVKEAWYLYQIFSDGDRKDAVKLHAYPYDHSSQPGIIELRTSIQNLVSKANEQENKTVYSFVSLGAAPKPVNVTGVSLDRSSIVKYEDEVAVDDKVEIVATISPANASDPSIEVTFNNDEYTAVKSVSKGDYNLETGTYKVYAHLTGTAGKTTVTVKTADSNLTTQFEAKCQILVKEKAKAMTPAIRVLSGTGSNYGDQKVLYTQTPGAQVFYRLDNRSASLPAMFDEAIEWNEAAGKYVSTNESLIEYTEPLVVGVDTSATKCYVHAVAVKKGLKRSDILDSYISYDVVSPWGDITLEDRDTEFLENTDNLNNDAYKGIWAPKSQLWDENIMYTGKAITIPDLRVYFGNKLLKSGTDYTLKYSNNINKSNVAQIKVTCKGNYSGTATLNFRINPRLLTKDDITWSVVQVNAKKNKAGDSYDGQQPDIKLKVKETGKLLKQGTDYTISYKSSKSDYYVSDISNPGVYSVAIDEELQGHANYTFPKKPTGEEPDERIRLADVIYCIGGDKMIAMNKTTVSKIANQKMADWEAKGFTVEPEFTVKYKGKDLKKGAEGHYTAEFKNNTAAGTASLVLIGTNKEVDGLIVNGTKTVTFKIAGLPFNATSVSVTGINESYPYTGNEVTPVYKLTYNGKDLTENTDYKVTYSKKGHTNAGKVAMTFTGTGVFSGSLKKSFKILQTEATALVIMNEDGYAWNEANQVEYYQKGAVTPKLNVWYNDNLLTKGKDYTLTYANNKAIGDYNAEKNGKRIGPSATVKLKGNYKGTRTVYFTIKQTDIGLLSMTLNDLVASTSPNKFTQKPVITDENGAVLKSGTDYEKVLVYTYDEDVDVTYKTGKGKNAKVVTDSRSRGDEVLKTDIIPVGTVIRVTATGMKNYTGHISETFSITRESVKNLKFSIDPAKTYYYTGSVVTPGKADIKVQKKVGKAWTDIPAAEATGYYDIIGYKNNIKAGTATITIKGKNGYAGTTTLKFKISKTTP
ncbi:MAG: hypothetical protein E7307_01695 [Butyrivibrio sp.]|nr:hypothetical protein [Butyrivibrio sp.]